MSYLSDLLELFFKAPGLLGAGGSLGAARGGRTPLRRGLGTVDGGRRWLWGRQEGGWMLEREPHGQREGGVGRSQDISIGLGQRSVLSQRCQRRQMWMKRVFQAFEVVTGLNR